MKTRKRALTAQIKPDTRNAIMDQLAAVANALGDKQVEIAGWRALAESARKERDHYKDRHRAAEDKADFYLTCWETARCRWWHRYVPARWRQ